MTDGSSDLPHTNTDDAAPQAPLLRAMARALLLEQLARCSWPLASWLAAHLGLALMGLAEILPLWGQWLWLAFLLAGVLVSAAWAVRQWQSLDQGHIRQALHQRYQLPARPLAMIDDHPANPTPIARALWQKAQARWQQQLADLPLPKAQPTLAKADPFGLRAIAALLLVTGLWVAGQQGLARLDAFFTPNWPWPATPSHFIIDAWLSPPDYSGLSDQPLTQHRPHDSDSPALQQAVSALQGSILHLVIGSDDGPLTLNIHQPTTPTSDALPNHSQQWAIPLTKDGPIRLDHDGQTIAEWQIQITQDAPPSIHITQSPQPTNHGDLALALALEDDLGLATLEYRLTLDENPKGYPATSQQQLDQWQQVTRSSDYYIIPLAAHPLAGSSAQLELRLRDSAGQETSSGLLPITLPPPNWQRPLARRISSLRNQLALAGAPASLAIATSLAEMSKKPDLFDHDSGIFLALRQAVRSLAATPPTSDAIHPVFDLLWYLALDLDDTRDADKLAALRQAQDALREALRNGASTAEIARLTDQLEEALNAYIADLLQEALARQDQDLSTLSQSEGSANIDSRDLQSLIDQIRNLANQGLSQSAEGLLAQLRQITENLELTQITPTSGDGLEAQELLQQLNKLQQAQQQLLDDSFAQSDHRGDLGSANANQPTGQLQRPAAGLISKPQPLVPPNWPQPIPDWTREDAQAYPPASPDPAATGSNTATNPADLAALQARQQLLEQQLSALTSALEELETDAPAPLEQAGAAMAQSSNALGAPNLDQAINAQTNALSALQQAAEALHQSFIQQFGNQYAKGRFTPAGTSEGQPPGADPFGREAGAIGLPTGNVTLPSESDSNLIRAIRDDLRKGAFDPNNPAELRHYLQELLAPFR